MRTQRLREVKKLAGVTRPTKWKKELGFTAPQKPCSKSLEVEGTAGVIPKAVGARDQRPRMLLVLWTWSPDL